MQTVQAMVTHLSPNRNLRMADGCSSPHLFSIGGFFLLKVRSSSPPKPKRLCTRDCDQWSSFIFFVGPFRQYKVHSSIQNQTELNWMCHHANENSHH